MINKPAETIQKKLVAQENKVEYLTVSSRMNVFQRFDDNCLVSINNSKELLKELMDSSLFSVLNTLISQLDPSSC